MQYILDRDIYQILCETQNKKVILYGTGNYAHDMIEKLRCLDIEVSYCVDDVLTDVRVEKSVKNVYELLLEREEFFVYIAKDNMQNCAILLEKLGFRHLKHYNSVYNAAGRIKPWNTFALDPVLGYSMPWEETLGTGVKMYRQCSTKSAYTIAILGNSTSDPCEYAWRSWGELLFEKCCGGDICIAVGATTGYSSGEELLKLIRDILPLDPDLVISYSGANDKATAYPFINTYHRTVSGILAAGRPKGMFEQGVAERVCYGTEYKGMSVADNWIRNQQMMHAITQELRIPYLAFVQPNLVTKKRLSGGKDEETLFYVDQRVVRQREDFREGIRGKLTDKAYIVDATHWFDDTDGLFYDYCHVTEEGNQIIADKVYECLLDAGFLST